MRRNENEARARAVRTGLESEASGRLPRPVYGYVEDRLNAA